MRFDPELAAIRFGTGLGPQAGQDANAQALLAPLAGLDAAAATYPIGGFADQMAHFKEARRIAQKRREGSQAEKDAGLEEFKALKRQLRHQQAGWLARTLARWVSSPDGFRERLAQFWGDHFTVEGKSGVMRHMAATFTEDAIRPHLAGRFADMLKAAVTHPVMLAYLDQFASVGEGSAVARNQGRGLNENLAREVLELHTLGVGGAYDQIDVREFAKLLAGFAFDRNGKVIFRARKGSPGAETVLGRRYGGRVPRLEDVHEVLKDLALHPDTAAHIARKLAVHFVADSPDEALVEHIRAAYLASGGNLMHCYAALLDHPAAWRPEPGKIKPPFAFIATSLKALGVAPAVLTGLKAPQVLRGFTLPMQLMGQTWEHPPGPDGWPEDGAHWITPQGLAARIQWAMVTPLLLVNPLPDPHDFARTALGTRAGEDLLFAARAAETRWEGIGLVLVSPEFQRR